MSSHQQNVQHIQKIQQVRKIASIVPIAEENFEHTMEETVLPALSACEHEDWFEVERQSEPLQGADGDSVALECVRSHANAPSGSGSGEGDHDLAPEGIHVVFYDGNKFLEAPESSARETIVISHGFTESAIKYSELAWYFLRAGFNVLIVEHRGHGLSLRETIDPDVVSISDWHHYISDFVGAVEQARARFGLEAPLHLFAHSLGGAIGAAVLESEPELFDKAVLSSPMMMPKTGMPTALALGLSTIADVVGKGTAKVPTLPVFAEEYGVNKSGGRSLARTKWYHGKRVEEVAYRTTAPSFNWVRAALRLDRSVLRPESVAKIAAKILIFQAGDDHWVSAGAETRFVAAAQRAGVNIRAVRWPISEHEIFSEPNDVLEPYLAMVLDFFAGD